MKTNEPNNYSREVSREVHSDPETNAYTSTTRSSETVKNTAGDSQRAAYDEGDAHGRVSESYRQAEYQDVRDNQTASRALLLGIILASVAALAGGTLYYLNQRNESPTPAAAPSPSKETTIIERQVPVPQQPPADRIIPIPQQPTTPPDINITVPNPQNQPAPAPAPDINITVPNAERQDAPSQPSPAPQTAPAPSSEKPRDLTPPARTPETSPDRSPTGSDQGATDPGTRSETGSPTGGESDTGSPGPAGTTSGDGTPAAPGSTSGAGAPAGSAP